MKFVDLNWEIETREKAIALQIEKSGLTKEQLIHAGRFNFMYDKHFRNKCRIKGDDNKAKAVFYDIAKTEMEFDYHTAMDIERQKDTLDVLKRVQRNNGFLVYQSEEMYDIYYAFYIRFFENEKRMHVLTWDAAVDYIEHGGMEIVPDYIQEDDHFQKMIANLLQN